MNKHTTHSAHRYAQARKPSPALSRAGQRKAGTKQQRPLLLDLFDILPTPWKGIFLGLLISLAPSFAISGATSGDQQLLSIVPLLGLTASGYIVGALVKNR